MPKTNLLEDPNVWGAFIAAKLAKEIGLPAGNYWEPQIARTLASAVRDGRKTRDEVELLMAFQLGIAKQRQSEPSVPPESI